MKKFSKANEFLRKHKNIVFVAVILVLVTVLMIHTVFSNHFLLSAGEDENTVVAASNINPRYNEIMEKGAIALSTDPTESTVTNSTPAQKTETTTTPSSTASVSGTTTDGTVPFATAIPPQSPADYSTQWNLGYLIAIDNPDASYSCSHVELSDEDRDLLERLCMGEFGSGGFIGASLIAQAVKDAMCFDGYASVADVIKYCHYDGSTSMGTTDECRQAVRYIFDDDHDAVQHRIMYMYNPYMVQSSFHESQNFILSYQGVRFFDRWGF